MYAFIFGCVDSFLVVASSGYSLATGVQVSHCSGFPCRGAQIL